MKALCLFGVLILAKVIALYGRELPLSAWAPFAFFWQDVLAALIFLVLDAAVRGRGVSWALYGAAVLYVAINTPVTLVLGTPLTWMMIRAARGPLADSITHYADVSTLGSLVAVIAAGVLLPMALLRRRVNVPRIAIAVAVAAIVIGAHADARIDTRGLHRNAFGALIASSVAHVSAAPDGGHLDAGAHALVRGAENLEPLRGIARDRNVVFIVLESTAARYLGVYGASPDPMPRLTELAREAVVFQNAYAVYPESIKGLFSALCSRYPAFNTPPEAHATVPCMSVAGVLSAAGYRTALFHSGRFEYLGMAPMIAHRGFDVLEDAGHIGGEASSSFGVDEPSTVQRMLAWVDSLQRGERFFLMYLPVAGHHPYAAPNRGPFDSTSDFGRYLNAVHDGDAALGALVDGLRARRLDDRTVFVVQGDHGEAFGQHPDNFAHSLFIYDENVRIPYLVAAPGLITDRIRVQRVASVIDTAPTILDLAGLARPDGYQGRSLLDAESRTAFFHADYSLGWLGLREACWKYIYEVDSGRSRLFDVCRDPDETIDRSEEFDVRARAYRDRVQRWAAAQAAAVEHAR